MRWLLMPCIGRDRGRFEASAVVHDSTRGEGLQGRATRSPSMSVALDCLTFAPLAFNGHQDPARALEGEVEGAKRPIGRSEGVALHSGMVRVPSPEGESLVPDPSLVERGDSLFVDLPSSSSTYTEQEWIPFLPKPGKYEHPKYGIIDVTPGQNAELIASVKNRVYQEHIPLDAEHETKLSGAMAWIRDMRLNEDGSGDALVDWTARGLKLVQDGRFKYVSPEWFRSWRDPASEQVHTNVIAGGALTTRPFFKDRALRALVASENGADVIGNEEELRFAMSTCKTCDKQFEGEGTLCPDCTKKEEQTQMTEQVTITMAEVEERITAARVEITQEFTEQLTTANTLAASERSAREDAEARLATLEHERRVAKFTDLVLDYEGGARWFGDAEQHVTMLETLATSFGETSDVFTGYVNQQQALAAQLRQSALFTEIGSSQAPERGGAEAQIEAMTKQRQADRPQLSYAQAYTEVLSTDEGRKLYAQL